MKASVKHQVWTQGIGFKFLRKVLVSYKRVAERGDLAAAWVADSGLYGGLRVRAMRVPRRTSRPVVDVPEPVSQAVRSSLRGPGKRARV